MLNQNEDMKANAWVKIKRIKAIALLRISKNKHKGIV